MSASSAAAAQGSLTVTNAYNGLGAVVASQTQSNSSVYWNLEEFRADKIGNVTYQRTRYAAAADKEPSTSFYTGDGLLLARKAAFPAGCPPGTFHLDTLYQFADAAGNVIRSGERRQSACDNNANNGQTVSDLYYSSHNKLAVVQKWTDASHTWEEYWYDALGRRVFTRTRHDLPFCGYPIVCPGFVDRTVWDGDQIIAEQRSSGLDSVTGGAPNFGTVRYVHLLGIDAPVAILDNRFSDARVIHYNWRGLAEASSWTNGNPADEELGAGIKVAWPAGQGVSSEEGQQSERRARRDVDRESAGERAGRCGARVSAQPVLRSGEWAVYAGRPHRPRRRAQPVRVRQWGPHHVLGSLRVVSRTCRGRREDKDGCRLSS